MLALRYSSCVLHEVSPLFASPEPEFAVSNTLTSIMLIASKNYLP
jgi:hypothetical protein